MGQPTPPYSTYLENISCLETEKAKFVYKTVRRGQDLQSQSMYFLLGNQVQIVTIGEPDNNIMIADHVRDCVL